ncbi:uncharacterized protein LOC119455058 [Dermacentor silvarum]|uniref:uncharacterized protein LOC119455058 n=1 Tax=Dermacentor silvarum TaxID=543639 RepID=UPI0021019A8A|nr:uncharacterized protein LOC119455058 [Dermacentor silvarum]
MTCQMHGNLTQIIVLVLSSDELPEERLASSSERHRQGSGSLRQMAPRGARAFYFFRSKVSNTYPEEEATLPAKRWMSSECQVLSCPGHSSLSVIAPSTGWKNIKAGTWEHVLESLLKRPAIKSLAIGVSVIYYSHYGRS